MPKKDLESELIKCLRGNNAVFFQLNDFFIENSAGGTPLRCLDERETFKLGMFFSDFITQPVQ